MNLTDIQNWHRYVYLVLGGLLAVFLGFQSGALAIPPGLTSYAPYVGIVVVFLTSILMPRAQTQTGPGAPPILSPPAKPPS